MDIKRCMKALENACRITPQTQVPVIGFGNLNISLDGHPVMATPISTLQISLIQMYVRSTMMARPPVIQLHARVEFNTTWTPCWDDLERHVDQLRITHLNVLYFIITDQIDLWNILESDPSDIAFILLSLLFFVRHFTVIWVSVIPIYKTRATWGWYL